MVTATELSTSEAARVLGIASETLRSWVRRRKIAARMTPLGMLFDIDDVHQLAAKREQAARERTLTQEKTR